MMNNLKNDKPEESDVQLNGNAQDDEREFKDLPPLEDIEAEEGEKKRSLKLEKDKEETLDENGYLDILDNKEILKKVLKEGDKNIGRPQRGSKVVINLVMRLKGSSEPIQSECLQNHEIFVGDYDVIHGVDLTIPLMDVGESAEIKISSRFGYGTLGNGDVPPDSSLEAEVELLSSEYIDEESSLTIDSRIKYGSRKKERGNFWYTRGDYSIAGQCYKRALDFLDVSESEVDENEKNLGANSAYNKLIELRKTTYSNLAAVQMKNDSYQAALKSINSALMHDEKNVKALFRKGKILDYLGELDEAIESFQGALKLDPDGRLIRHELNKLIAKRKEQLIKEKNMYKKMLRMDNETEKLRSSYKKAFLKYGLIASGLVTATISFLAYKFYQ